MSLQPQGIQLFIKMTLKLLKKMMKYRYFITYLLLLEFSFSSAGRIKKFNGPQFAHAWANVLDFKSQSKQSSTEAVKASRLVVSAPLHHTVADLGSEMRVSQPRI